tara:strand:- start:5585 stop:6517 length:933 start_codon:yes stop_codon:yes gene_type:complete
MEDKKNNEQIEEAQEIKSSDNPVGNDGIPNFFSPLADEMKSRDYAKPPQQDTGEIKEPEFKSGIDLNDLNKESEENSEPSEFDNITNEDVNQLEGKEKRIACEQLVNTCLDTYEMAHGLAQKYAKKDEQELLKAIQNGDIDANLEIPIDENGTTTNAVEFFQQYNEQVEEALSYDKEFGEKVKPAMIRVFEKRGWAMTDEQYLMYMFGKDMAIKTTMVIGLKKQANMIFNTFVEMKQQQVNAMESEMVKPIKPDTITSEPKEENNDFEKPIKEIIIEEPKQKKSEPKKKAKRGRPAKSKSQKETEQDLTK